MLGNRSKWLHAVGKVLTGHPDWNPKHYESKRLTVTLDSGQSIDWSS